MQSSNDLQNINATILLVILMITELLSNRAAASLVPFRCMHRMETPALQISLTRIE